MARYLRHCPRHDTLTSSRAIKSVRLTFVRLAAPSCVATRCGTGRNGNEKRAPTTSRSLPARLPRGKNLIGDLRAWRATGWPTDKKKSFGRLPFQARNTWLLLNIHILLSHTSKIRISERYNKGLAKCKLVSNGQQATTINNLNRPRWNVGTNYSFVRKTFTYIYKYRVLSLLRRYIPNSARARVSNLRISRPERYLHNERDNGDSEECKLLTVKEKRHGVFALSA